MLSQKPQYDWKHFFILIMAAPWLLLLSLWLVSCAPTTEVVGYRLPVDPTMPVLYAEASAEQCPYGGYVGELKGEPITLCIAVQDESEPSDSPGKGHGNNGHHNH